MVVAESATTAREPRALPGQRHRSGLVGSVFFLADAPPSAGGFAHPVVEEISDAAEIFQSAQFVVEFAHAGFGGFALIGSRIHSFDVSLEVDDATCDADANLGDVEPMILLARAVISRSFITALA
jgi:hypothetical protein